MLTKDVSQELEDVFQTLQTHGKQLTVATVKARLSTPVPMPALIRAIKSWKASNSVPKVEVSAPNLTTDEQVKQLMEQVKKLTERVHYLEQSIQLNECK